MVLKTFSLYFQLLGEDVDHFYNHYFEHSTALNIDGTCKHSHMNFKSLTGELLEK